MTMGVYLIRNGITGMAYIGCSSNIESRWAGHRSTLRAGEHANNALQRDWAIYGESVFAVVVLEEVASTDDIPAREAAWVRPRLSRSLRM